MRFLDPLFQSNNVDVGRSLAVSLFTSVVWEAYTAFSNWLGGRGSINVVIPIGIVIACGLWAHRPWARIVSLCLAWCVTVSLYLFVALSFFGISGRYRIGVGTLILSNSNPWQAVASIIFMLPIAHLLLGALRSSKALDEFKMPNQSKDSAP
jgi:hypothetical protein